jgi:hypothetical protein
VETFASQKASQAVVSLKIRQKTPQFSGLRRPFAPLDIHNLFHIC